MDWEFWQNFSAIILAVGVFILRDLVPYISTRIYIYRYNSDNQAIVHDLNQKLLSSIFHFPCDIVVVCAGYLIGRVIFATEELSSITESTEVAALAMKLNFSNLWFWITILAVFPACVFLTNLIDSMYFEAKRIDKEKRMAILLCVIAYIATVLFTIVLLVLDAAG